MLQLLGVWSWNGSRSAAWVEPPGASVVFKRWSWFSGRRLLERRNQGCGTGDLNARRKATCRNKIWMLFRRWTYLKRHNQSSDTGSISVSAQTHTVGRLGTSQHVKCSVSASTFDSGMDASSKDAAIENRLSIKGWDQGRGTSHVSASACGSTMVEGSSKRQLKYGHKQRERPDLRLKDGCFFTRSWCSGDATRAWAPAA